MKKHFNKEFVMAKKDEEDFGNSTKGWICNEVYVDSDAEVKDHCHIKGNYKGSAHRNCNIKVKLNHKIPVFFNNLKNYDSHSIMQVFRKFNFKEDVLLNGLKNI